MQLYLDRIELVWFKRNKNQFKDWATLRKLFLEKYGEGESEFEAWEKIKTIKLRDYESAEEWETALEELLEKAKVTDTQTKWRHLNTEAGEPLFEALVEKFEKVSLNMINKMDQTIDKALSRSYRYLNENPQISNMIKQGQCFNCKKKGHRKFECPELRTVNRKETESKEKKKVNSIELLDQITHSNNALREKENEVWLVNKRPREKNYVKDLEKPEPKRHRIEPMETDGTKLEEAATKRTRVVKKRVPGMAVGIEQYSLKSDLSNFLPSIKLPQLLLEAPRIRSEYLELGKNVEEKPMNQFNVMEYRTTYCKALVGVFNEFLWAVVDTGAACSVVNNRLLERLGLQVEYRSKQILVTADGGTHETAGKVFRVPLSIAGHEFPVDLLVIDRKDDFLVLGTDWFVEHQVKLDMATQELTLPKEHIDIIITISTKTPGKEVDDPTELFLVFKEHVTQPDTETYNDPRIQEVKEANKVIFAN
ncbi:hypothetical protein AX774_g7665 [Zancudomyces culisetae]|uniref:CCHC-type domain-containing protein n=1 Tax=Zancudomyces culisetae TaxID=1213189 RepID=A0A1R1PDI7_ZANCU|nr:hypothetical protein AX774_g7665 [Zancudomyces culisetae]|eukprot:OMH78932.1 hypothetical protein AX774_g7665 [Zancudomyces culisetae]